MEILLNRTTNLRALIDPQQFNTSSEKESDISLSLLLPLAKERASGEGRNKDKNIPWFAEKHHLLVRTWG